MTYYLGVFGYGPNPSAALLHDGRVVAFVEEERFNRIKTSPNNLPINSVLFCLKQAGITMEQVAAVGFGWDAERYSRVMPSVYERQRREWPVDDEFDQSHYETYLMSLYHPKKLLGDLRLGLASKGQVLDLAKVRFLPHHLCHCASTYYASGFDEAAILSIDGSGEEFTTLLAYGKGSEITEIEHFELPHSLGGYFATFTEFLGFIPYHDEGKLMGLAPYGSYSQELQDKLEQVLQYDPESGDFTVNPYFRFLGKRGHGRLFTDRLVELFGPPRLSKQPLEQHHRDLAFAVQWRLEQVAKALARRVMAKAGSRNLCLAGGVAMNCKMNGALSQLPEVDHIYVQPASADNGIALGAAYLVAKQGGAALEPMPHAYWGPSFDDAEVEAALKESKLEYRRSPDMIAEVAQYLRDGRIIGWFQGRMEVGARALGGRSILANPLIEDMRDKLNLEVKHRENWRPFCPSMLAEAYDRYFDTKHASDYMILAYPVREEMQTLVPAVVHVDGTARPQTVRQSTNPRFHALLTAFGALTGHPVLVNTSFNIQGEPVVCTPRDALRCFGGTGIDILVMNDFIAVKPNRG